MEQCSPVLRSSPDMFVIGFQEIVPLTAQQIVQADPEKRYCIDRIVYDMSAVSDCITDVYGNPRLWIHSIAELRSGQIMFFFAAIR